MRLRRGKYFERRMKEKENIGYQNFFAKRRKSSIPKFDKKLN